MYLQNYNPMGNVFLSIVVAAIPILTLLYFIALHPHRDKQGVKHLGIAAPYAAFYGVIAAFIVSCLAFGMPLPTATWWPVRPATTTRKKGHMPWGRSSARSGGTRLRARP